MIIILQFSVTKFKNTAVIILFKPPISEVFFLFETSCKHAADLTSSPSQLIRKTCQHTVYHTIHTDIYNPTTEVSI